MKRILFGGLILALLVFCFSGFTLGQSMPVNIHQYSISNVVDDSTDVNPFRLGRADADTTQSFDLSTFNQLACQIKFRGFDATNAMDSIAMRVYFQTTIDDTIWTKVDSLVAAKITSAKILEVSGADTCYYQKWTIPGCAYKGRYIFVADVGIDGKGVYIWVKNMKQR